MNSEFFTNFGYVEDIVPESLINQLKEIVKEKELEKQNSNLAGNIKKEFKIPKALPVMKPYIFQLIKKYEDSFHLLDTINYCTDNVPLELEGMWVNFQEKHEFNPAHTHSGVYSFAIWLQVPYLIEDEREQGPGKESNHNAAGTFEFLYTTTLGNIAIKSLPVDRRWEGRIVFFPAKLHHQVHPFFTSDDYRISISGNIRLDTRNLRSKQND
jgi:hypothetical protein